MFDDPDPNRSDDQGSNEPAAAEERRSGGGWSPVRHVEGVVVHVHGSDRRPRPSALPLVLAFALVGVALVLPLLATALPVVLLVFVIWFLLRRRGLAPGLRLPGMRGRAGRGGDTDLSVSTFRLRPAVHSGTPGQEVECHFVRSAADGPLPLVPGEHVSVRGIRSSGNRVDVTTLVLGGGRTTLRAATVRSNRLILGVSALIGAGGVWLLLAQLERMPPITMGSLLQPFFTVAYAFVPLLVIYVLFRVLFRRR